MLKIKKIPVTYCKENVIFLNAKNDFLHSRDDLRSLRAEVHSSSEKVCGMVAVVYDDKLLAVDEVGLSAAAFDRLGAKQGSEVSLMPFSVAPSSMNAVRRKINGGVLALGEYRAIVDDIANGRYSGAEITAFEVALSSFPTPQEIYFLTKAMVAKGHKLKWLRDTVVDEACIGGVAGNRVSPIVQAIVMAAGMCMPKVLFKKQQDASSSLDVMDMMCETNLDEDIFAAMIDSFGGGVINGKGEMCLSNVEMQLSEVEESMSLGNTQIMVASIITKAVLTGVTNLLVDIPVSSYAIVKTVAEATRLKKLFEYVAGMMGLGIDVVITDGSEPVGNGIGPMLEARDVMNVLNRSKEASVDLREKALFVAGKLLEVDSKVVAGEGYKMAKEILDSGKALEQMNLIIENQTGKSLAELGQLTRDITASSSGKIEFINCMQINRIAMTAGAPLCAGAGVDLLKHSGDKVEQGEVIYRIYSAAPMEFAFASGIAEGDSGYKIVPLSEDYV